jgi:hypothetical protein
VLCSELKGELDPVHGPRQEESKRLDAGAFATHSKTAREVPLRHEQAAHARLHKSRTITDDNGNRVRVLLDMVHDGDAPHACLFRPENPSWSRTRGTLLAARCGWSLRAGKLQRGSALVRQAATDRAARILVEGSGAPKARSLDSG